MADTGGQPEKTLEAAIALGPQIRAAAAEIEAGRRLPAHIVDAMKRPASSA